MLILFALLQIGDGVLTYIGLKRGLGEMNPIAREVIAQLGIVPAIALLKVLGVVVVWGLSLAAGDASAWVLIPACIIALYPIYHNVRALNR